MEVWIISGVGWLVMLLGGAVTYGAQHQKNRQNTEDIGNLRKELKELSERTSRVLEDHQEDMTAVKVQLARIEALLLELKERLNSKER